jgi:DNA-binding GntR family transcriptional regulator
MRDVNDRISRAAASAVAEHYRLNARLHALVVEPCDNNILTRMLDQLWSMPSALRMYYHQVGTGQVGAGDPIEQMVIEHEAIIDALERGDADTTHSRVRSHLEGAKRAALEHFESQAS